jgi:formyltetrahydrofolate-dependent phosphoribosylglycinamide formyltransferase
LAESIIAHIDGGSRGNPGPAAAAFVLADSQGGQLQAKAFFLGEATNNVAEYTAMHKALEAAKSLGARKITVYSDSELLVRQLNGQYKVKSDQIRPVFAKTVAILAEFESWQVRHIIREDNKQADELVNRALDIEKDVEMKPKGTKRGKPIRLGVLISGGGTTLINLVECIKHGKLNAEVAVVISSRSTVAGVDRARAAGLNVKIIRKKYYPDIDEFSKLIEQELVAANVELVVQGGWLCLWKIPPRFENKVMNIHPALLPNFGGQGMWGHHVHEAVLRAGCRVSGCTVHFCTNEYDNGPIIVQRCCPVKDDDTPETLAARVFEQECIAYPEAIRLFAEGKLTVRDGRVRIEPAAKTESVRL